MFKNYFKSAWRNLMKNKTSSFINISGLAVGMAVTMLICLWIWDELSFDTYNTNYNAIAQVARKEISNGDVSVSEQSNHFPIPLAAELRTNYNNMFKHVALASESNEHVIAFDNNQFSEQGMYVEKDFTDMFTFKMVAGSNTEFDEPNSILLNKSVAAALFGKANPVGKVLKLDNKQDVKVTGVFEDFPNNTKLSDVGFFCPFSLLVNTDQSVKNALNDWGNSSFHIFTQTVPGLSIEKISGVIKDVYWSKIKSSQPQSSGDKVSLFLHPMKDWHLRSEWKNGVQEGGEIQTVWLFGLIGMFVLLLACINFMNLITARSEKRAKEVGVRKTLGSLKSQLIKQFLSESLLVVCIAFIVSIGIVLLSLNWFNEIAAKKISFPFSNYWFWLFSVVIILITAFIAGCYPALYLSSFKPIKVLKGTFKASRFSSVPRKVLVTLQFVVSIILIVGTIVVYRQIQFAQNRPIGYNRNGLIHIQINTPDLNGKYDVLQKELLASGGAIGYAQSSSATTENNYFDDHFLWEGKDANVQKQGFALRAVSYDYGKTVGWQFLEGRDFSRSFSTDNKAVILNEAAEKYMRLKNPVGKTIRWNDNVFTIVGVIKDMVTESPYAGVQQSLFFIVPDITPNITIRLNPQLSASEAISRIQPVFRKLNPSSPFEYKFVDDEYAHKFAAEQRIGTLAATFTLLAIFISCLGIFGMASFVAEQRIKEIGVRKVLGASIFNLWQLLSKDFVAMVLISFLIAAPIAYYFMYNWLQNYQYRTNLSWWIFAAAGVGAMMITLLTVSFQSIKAAVANPVKSLRTE
jgi:ABC-type antimicrobial peptide transport system permease subunit